MELSVEEVNEKYIAGCQVVNEQQLAYLARRRRHLSVILKDSKDETVLNILKPQQEQAKAPKIQQAACRIKKSNDYVMTPCDDVKIRMVKSSNVVMEPVEKDNKVESAPLLPIVCHYNNSPVRVIKWCGKLWLSLKNICDAFDLKITDQVLENAIDDVECMRVSVCSVRETGRTFKIVMITQKGLRKFLTKFLKESDVKAFNKWATKNILTIRNYSTVDKILHRDKNKILTKQKPKHRSNTDEILRYSMSDVLTEQKPSKKPKYQWDNSTAISVATGNYYWADGMGSTFVSCARKAGVQNTKAFGRDFSTFWDCHCHEKQPYREYVHPTKMREVIHWFFEQSKMNETLKIETSADFLEHYFEIIDELLKSSE
jgi:prophage antirepressor-like protein